VKFTQLKLTGFKSFVDSTELRIDQGLTGIIGPNGCGKSNLLEALRWVMGATSAKSLRGGGMEDVIFSGTDMRPARNHAEVVLTIDNAERRAPPAFNDAPTLEVTRRITRGSGSAYKINGEEVRAKDVQLLFADAGTGANSPALVRQGQISELIAAKPQNRRRVLEEAAGVSGLRARRHEAELRLKGAETNLDRLQDVIDETDSRHAALQKQARQASRYRKLSTSIRTLEAAVWLNRWRQAASQVEEAEGALSECLEAAETATRSAADARTRAEVEAAAREPARLAEAEAAAALRALERERDRLERDASDVQNRITSFETRLTELAASTRREEQIAEDAESSRGETAAQIERLDEETAKEKAALSFAEAASRDAETRRTQKEAVLDAKAREAAENRAALEAARRDAERLVARLSQIEREMSSASEELERVQASTALSDLTEAETAVEAAERALTLARTRSETADTIRAEAETAFEQAMEIYRERQSDHEALQREAQALERLLASSTQDTPNPAVDAVRARPGFEQALAAALGDDLDASLDDDAPRHWQEIAIQLDQLPGGSVPLSDHVRAPAALKARLDSIGVVKADRAEEASRKLKPGQCIVTQDGDLWRWDGLVARADAPTAAVARLEQRNRLEEIESELTKQTRPLETALQEKDTAHTAVTTARQDSITAREALPEADRTARAAINRVGDLRERAAKDSARATALRERLERLAAELAEARAAHLVAAQACEADAQADADIEALEQAREDAERARMAAADARAAFESVRRESEMRKQRTVALQREHDAWAKRCESARNQLGEIATQISDTQARLTETRELPAKLEEQLHGLGDKIDKAEALAREAREKASTTEDQVKDADSAARKAEAAASAARESRAAAEARLSGARERLNETTERLQDATGSAPGALASRIEDEDITGLSPDELERRLNEARASRDRLGAVNLRADEEAEELAKNVEEMAKERDDLVEAISRLRKAVDELSREGRARLLEAFEIVDGHFRNLFATLFEGGHAELRLTENDDPLEAGLEIFACPPGKKLDSMSLMSGGEQALTASALIFAVFLSNPAPVCVMDEVDAPLDDANVDRYCRMLAEMRRLTETRFLVITHNPLTMSRVDRLFGVTMAERGVSQLVSVDLVSAEQLVAAE